MARSSARQRRLAKASTPAVAPVGPATVKSPAAGANRLIMPACLVAITPVIVVVATRHDHAGVISALIRLTIASLLFQLAIVAATSVRAARSPAGTGRPSRLLVTTTAVLAGAALLVTASLPVIAWFAGLGMFACFLVDAATARNNLLRWAFVTFGIAFLCCWVFAGSNRWDNLLWWSFAFAAFAAVALNSASPAGGAERILSRKSIGGALAGVGLLCSVAAIVIALRSPGAAILIAIEGAFALLLIQRSARRFGLRGVFGVASAASFLAAAVFIVAL